MKVVHGEGHITLVQGKYCDALVKNMGLVDCLGALIPCDPSIDLSTPGEKAADEDYLYRSIVRSLLYIDIHARSDIAVATSMLARHVDSPSKKHQKALVKVVKYLKTYRKLGLRLSAGKMDQLRAYFDVIWDGEKGSGRRSRTGIVLFYGEAPAYLTTSLQQGVTLSSTEAEYVALSEASKVIVWPRRVLDELGIKQQTTAVFEGNAGTFKWTSGHVAEGFRRSKHVDIRYHHVRETVLYGAIQLIKVPTSEMVADFLTKPLQSKRIEKAKFDVNLVDYNSEEAY